ncbi:MAG: sigma 54-interacting transcriptional regulator [Acidobacteriota bacterium]
MVRRRLPRVLVIDDQSRTAEFLARSPDEFELLDVGVASDARRFHARSWREAEGFLTDARRRPDAVVLDLRFDISDEELLPDLRPLGDNAAARRLRQERRERQGLFILERLRRAAPDLAVVLTTAYEDIPFEEEAARLRADALTYAVGEDAAAAEDVLRLLRRALAEREAPPATGRFFWGSSPAMRELRRRVLALAPTPMPLLVTGPTGTGKNILVREVLHPASGRPGPLIAFDCATVPEGLLPASLFGVVRGAFTGAAVDRAGVFEAAARGTLFLDEIENLSSDAQKMLLTSLNEGRIRRVGSASELPHTARVVAAANVDLTARVAEGKFRSDLLMRLNPVLRLELPALSERRMDLPALARFAAAGFFADQANEREISAAVRAVGADPSGPRRLDLGQGDIDAREPAVLFTLPRKAWAAMVRHPWPGNIRQFDMVLVDALATAVYGGMAPRLDAAGRAVFPIDARLVFDLLAGARISEESGDRIVIDRPKTKSVAGFRREVEREVFRRFFREAKGSFEGMAEQMTGSPAQARAVRLRFNRLGLSVRGER